MDNREDQLLLSQKKILERVALGGGFQETLDELCVASELLVSESVCSVMVFDASRQHLNVISGPNLPSAVVDRLNCTVPGERSGSCALAVFQNAPVYVSNTLEDECWSDVRQLALDFSISACWSHPITNTEGEVVGSFAISSFEVREPSYFQQQLLTESANIAGIILERRDREKDLWDKAHQDKLTGLCNRPMFDMTLNHAISSARRHQAQLAVLFVDLDNFKVINDTYGHKAGDDVLREIASRLKRCQRSSDTLARYGGDEFTLLLENIDDLNSVTQVAQRIIDECAIPIITDGYSAGVSASVGISLFPNDALELRELLSFADRAMYKAKSKGRNGFYFYEEGLTRVVEAKKRLSIELRSALKNNEFVLFYQPLFHTDGSMSRSLEALVRWNHPTRGLLTTGDFLPMVEEEGLMDELSEWVLQAACVQAKSWLDRGFLLDKMAINFSLYTEQRDFYEMVGRVLDKTQLPPSYLELDIAESLLAGDSGELIDELEELRKRGIGVALDNFGTGGVSLALLARLPIDLVKMDRDFVDNLTVDNDDPRLIKAIVAMASSLGVPVLAKRIESELQREILAREGCDLLQGYLFSAPLAVAEIEKRLQRR
ncbi:MAG: EAL domain-containing protein [Gammaproteobacteria bacterium]|nr:EAL domain-containing protein [Gammaproteobacteria bacterium]MBQ0841126.1 EAL domain-containing protein [Gammaproteobacteria bacterium]